MFGQLSVVSYQEGHLSASRTKINVARRKSLLGVVSPHRLPFSLLVEAALLQRMKKKE
jgi:hypothetical protein